MTIVVQPDPPVRLVVDLRDREWGWNTAGSEDPAAGSAVVVAVAAGGSGASCSCAES